MRSTGCAWSRHLLEAYRAALGAGRSQATATWRPQGVVRRARVLPAPRATSTNAASSAGRRARTAPGSWRKARPAGGARPARASAVASGRPSRRRRVVRPEQLHADVVTVRIVSVHREQAQAPPRRRTAPPVSMSPYFAKTGKPSTAPSAYTSTTSRPVTNRRASKSWTLKSRKSPPDAGMYSSWGGAGSWPDHPNHVERAEPAGSTRSRAAMNPGSKRRWKPIWTVTPSRRHVDHGGSTRDRARSASRRRWFPRLGRWMMRSAWASVAAAMTMAPPVDQLVDPNGPRCRSRPRGRRCPGVGVGDGHLGDRGESRATWRRGTPDPPGSDQTICPWSSSLASPPSWNVPTIAAVP